jgi:hypothetical protein
VGQRKVGAAPHRGNASKPIRKQGKANTARTTNEPKAPQANPPKPAPSGQIPLYEYNTHILEI